MSEVQSIMIILSIGFAIWQMILVVGWAAMIRSAQYKNVKMGTTPGLLAVILAILVVLL